MGGGAGPWGCCCEWQRLRPSGGPGEAHRMPFRGVPMSGGGREHLSTGLTPLGLQAVLTLATWSAVWVPEDPEAWQVHVAGGGGGVGGWPESELLQLKWQAGQEKGHWRCCLQASSQLQSLCDLLWGTVLIMNLTCHFIGLEFKLLMWPIPLIISYYYPWL